MTDDDRLRAELEALERAAPTHSPVGLSSAGTPGWLRIGLLGVTVASAILVGSVLFSPRGPGQGGGPSQSPSSRPNDPAVASVQDREFMLTISSPHSTWSTEDAIEVSARLDYLGGRAETSIGQGIPPILFGLREAGTEAPTLVGIQQQPCVQYVLRSDDPLVEQFAKGVPMDADGHPDDNVAPFDASFLADPQLHLPPGRWEFTAHTAFDENNCGDGIQLTVSVTITVVDPSSPSSSLPAAETKHAEPSHRATAPPDPSPTAPLPPVDDDPAEITGVLRGAPNMGALCIWLTDANGDRWEIIWPDQYEDAFEGDEAVLLHDGEIVARGGDVITVTGATSRRYGTFCMVGVPYEATAVVAIRGRD
jgi:hypothetical protein